MTGQGFKLTVKQLDQSAWSTRPRMPSGDKGVPTEVLIPSIFNRQEGWLEKGESCMHSKRVMVQL